MRTVPFSDRVVEVIAQFGGDYVYGSGCIVNGRYVLTAAHLLRRDGRGPDSVGVRDCGKDSNEAEKLDCVEDLDLAVLEVTERNDLGVLRRNGNSLPPLPLATLNRSSSTPVIVDQVHVLGYPNFAKEDEGPRDRVQAFGFVPALSHRTEDMDVQVVLAPQALMSGSAWAGMSGGPVVANGCLLGVISRHNTAAGQSTLTAVSVAAVLSATRLRGSTVEERGPRLWHKWLGLRDPASVVTLPVPNTPPYHATFRDRAASVGARAATGCWADEINRIAAFSRSGDRALWVTGDAYSGKSTLLQHVIALGLPDDVDAVYYFLSSATSDADGNRFLTAVVPQLAALCGATPTHQGRDELLDLWDRAGQLAEAAGRHLLLVVDGVDEEEDRRPLGIPRVLDLLPRPTRANTHLLLSARVPQPVSSTHPMYEARVLRVLPPLGSAGLGVLPQDEIAALVHHSDWVDCLGHLAAASGPLSERDLATLNSAKLDIEPTPGVLVQVREVLRSCGRSLDHLDSRTEALWWFAHSALLVAARTNPYLGSPRYRERIHDWAEYWGSSAAPSGIAWQSTPGMPVPTYLLNAYPQTLTVEQPERLANLVTDVGWVDAAVRVVGVEQVVCVLLSARERAKMAGLPRTRIESLSTLLSVVRGEARHFARPLVAQEGFVLRHLLMHAAELGAEALKQECAQRLGVVPTEGPEFGWTTRSVSPAFVGESERCGSEILGMAAAPDGRVVTVGRDGWVLVWEPRATGSRPVRVGHHDGAARAVAVTDSGRVITGGDDRCVRMWSLTNPAGCGLLGRHGGAVRAVAAMSDERFVTCGHDGRVLMWDVGAADPVEVGRHPSAVRTIAVTGDDNVITGGDDGQVLEWALPWKATPELDARHVIGPRLLGRHDGSVRALVDVKTAVVTGGDDRRILHCLRPTNFSEPVVADIARHRDSIRALLVCEKDRLIALAGNGRIHSARLAEPDEWAEIGRHGTGARAIARTTDGLLVTGGTDGRIRVWDTDVVGAARPHSAPVTNAAEGVAIDSPDTPATAIAVAADGRVISGNADGLIQVLKSGREIASVGLGSGRIRALAVTGEGRIVSRSSDGSLHLWHLDQPKMDPVRLGTHSGLAALAVHDDELLLTGGFDGRVLLWDLLAPSEPPRRLVTHNTVVTAVLSAGSSQVISGDAAGQLASSDLRRIDSRHQRWLTRGSTPNAGIGALASLPSGAFVAGSDNGAVLLHRLSGGRPDSLGSHGSPVTCAVTLPGGRVATNGTDGFIRVWCAADSGPEGRKPRGTAPGSVLFTTSAVAIATNHALGESAMWHLALAHRRGGISTWVYPPGRKA